MNALFKSAGEIPNCVFSCGPHPIEPRPKSSPSIESQSESKLLSAKSPLARRRAEEAGGWRYRFLDRSVAQAIKAASGKFCAQLMGDSSAPLVTAHA